MTLATGMEGVFDEAKRLYDSGMNLDEIAKTIGWGTRSTSHFLLKRGVINFRFGPLYRREWRNAWSDEELATLAAPTKAEAVRNYHDRFGSARSNEAIESRFYKHRKKMRLQCQTH